MISHQVIDFRTLFNVHLLDLVDLLEVPVLGLGLGLPGPSQFRQLQHKLTKSQWLLKIFGILSAWQPPSRRPSAPFQAFLWMKEPHRPPCCWIKPGLLLWQGNGVFSRPFVKPPLAQRRGVRVKNGILFPAEFIANKTASIRRLNVLQTAEGRRSENAAVWRRCAPPRSIAARILMRLRVPPKMPSLEVTISQGGLWSEKGIVLMSPVLMHKCQNVPVCVGWVVGGGGVTWGRGEGSGSLGSGSLGSWRNSITPDCFPPHSCALHGLNARLSSTYEGGGTPGQLGARTCWFLRMEINSASRFWK